MLDKLCYLALDFFGMNIAIILDNSSLQVQNKRGGRIA